MKFKRPQPGLVPAGETRPSHVPYPKAALGLGCRLAVCPDLGDDELFLIVEVIGFDGDELRVRALHELFVDVTKRVVVRGDEFRVARDCAFEPQWEGV